MIRAPTATPKPTLTTSDIGTASTPDVCRVMVLSGLGDAKSLTARDFPLARLTASCRRESLSKK